MTPSSPQGKPAVRRIACRALGLAIAALAGCAPPAPQQPLEVEVRNDGGEPARDVRVELREDGGVRPALSLAEIPPGGSVTRRFDVRFSQVGSHTVEARLPADILPADNARSCVIEVVDRINVLLVADDPGGSGRDSIWRNRSTCRC